MNYIRDLQLKLEDGYTGIIEIPIGTNSKYELDEKSFDKLIKVREVKGKYPFYYGCFPRTLAGDNDPLDMILLSRKNRACLDIVAVYPIGVIKTIDNGEVDDKIIVIAKDEIIKNLDKLEKTALKFLSRYKGKNANTQIDYNIYDCEEAEKLIEEARINYDNKHSVTTLISSF